MYFLNQNLQLAVNFFFNLENNNQKPFKLSHRKTESTCLLSGFFVLQSLYYQHIHQSQGGSRLSESVSLRPVWGGSQAQEGRRRHMQYQIRRVSFLLLSVYPPPSTKMEMLKNEVVASEKNGLSEFSVKKDLLLIFDFIDPKS